MRLFWRWKQCHQRRYTTVIMVWWTYNVHINNCADTAVKLIIISCYITEKDEEKRRAEKMRKYQEKQERKQRKLRVKGDHNQCLLLLFSAVFFWLCGFICREVITICAWCMLLLCVQRCSVIKGIGSRYFDHIYIYIKAQHYTIMRLIGITIKFLGFRLVS